MNEPNPYTAPNARLADPPATSSQDTARLNSIASGQRLLVIAVLVSFFASALRTSVGDIALLISLASMALSIYGAFRLSMALGNGVAMRIVYALLMIVPLINLIAMLMLSSRATSALRAAGYRVGLFGASSR
jgi:hypothetical protein